MRSGKHRVVKLSLLSTLAMGLLPATAFAQELIPTEKLDEWFYSRLLWGSVIGVGVGLLVGLAHLCRLQFQLGSLNVNSAARRRFLTWLVVLLTAGSVLLFLDAWLLYSFSALSLQFGEALTQVWFNYRTLLVLATTLAAFTLAVAFATRLKPDCRCRYAFIRGPKGR